MRVTQIISSYNRPAQLDLLLRSCRDQWPECTDIMVLWRADNDDFIKGYDKVIAKCGGSDIGFLYESNFKHDLLALMGSARNDYILMNSDDNAFINPINFGDFRQLRNEVAFSLRLGKGLNRCEPAKREMIEPRYSFEDDNIICWDWRTGDRGVCYYYPQPYDSNIYRKDWLLNRIKDGDWHNPYSLENWLNTHRDESLPYMAAFKEPKLISIMANTTGQNDNPNMMGRGLSCEELNKKWLDGWRISTDGLYGMKPMQCHIYHDYKLERDE